jgi:phosphate transport system permease protein
MGFAIVPVIYSIAEEALSNVPKSPNRRLARPGSDALANRSASGAAVRQPGNLFRRDDRVRARDRGNDDRPDGDREYSDPGLELGERLSDAVGQYRRGNSRSPAWRKSLSRVLPGRLALFIVTFVINSFAELIRQRLRDKYSHG